MNLSRIACVSGMWGVASSNSSMVLGSRERQVLRIGPNTSHQIVPPELWVELRAVDRLPLEAERFVRHPIARGQQCRTLGQPDDDILMADVYPEALAQRPEHGILPALGRRLEPDRPHLGQRVVRDDFASHRPSHRLESPARGERRLGRLNEASHRLERRLQPRAALRHGVVPATSEENHVGSVEVVGGGDAAD